VRRALQPAGALLRLFRTRAAPQRARGGAHTGACHVFVVTPMIVRALLRCCTRRAPAAPWQLWLNYVLKVLESFGYFSLSAILTAR
jgi:hypothetical protein